MRKSSNEDGAGSTRQRILDEALTLFAQHGFAGTSMRMLARATDLRESSLYNHFSGKEDLYQCTLAQWGPAEFVSRLESAEYRALSDNPVEFFRLCATHLVDRWLDTHERLFMATISNAGHGSKPKMRFYDALFHVEIDLLEDYFAGFSLLGLIRASNPRETARIFAGGLTFIRMEHVTMRPTPSSHAETKKAVASYIDNFITLVVKPPSHDGSTPS